jgi:hypothetical protein
MSPRSWQLADINILPNGHFAPQVAIIAHFCEATLSAKRRLQTTVTKFGPQLLPNKRN